MKKVFYPVEVVNGLEWNSAIAFSEEKEAEKFVKMSGYNSFDGRSGWKIKEDYKKENVKVYPTANQFFISKKEKEIRRLKAEIAQLEEEDEME